jgi:hypothetical protein
MPSTKSSTAAAVSIRVATVDVGVQAPSPSVNIDTVVVPSPSPSPEEPSPLPPAADDKESQAPAIRELLLGPDLPSSLDSKQTRAYERERHLVKKLATTTKIKLQKAKSRQAWTQSVLYTMNKSSTQEGVVKSSFSPLSAGVHGLVLGEKEKLLRDEDYDTLDGIVVEATAMGPVMTTTIHDHKREVKLADLISTANTKRGRRRAGETSTSSTPIHLSISNLANPSHLLPIHDYVVNPFLSQIRILK